MIKRLFLTLGLIVTTVCGASAQEMEQSLARHNFFYAGQSKQRRMFMVKNGQVSWQYDDKLKRGEISDAVLMSDGNILVAHQYGVAEVTKNSETVWSYAAPEGTEIHTIQPIGRKHVVFVQNGKPAKAVVMEIPQCNIVREFELPINEKGSVHGQFRNARLTSRGTLLVVSTSLPVTERRWIGGVTCYRGVCRSCLRPATCSLQDVRAGFKRSIGRGRPCGN